MSYQLLNTHSMQKRILLILLKLCDEGNDDFLILFLFYLAEDNNVPVSIAVLNSLGDILQPSRR